MGICSGYMYSLSKDDDLLNTVSFILIVKLLHKKYSNKKDQILGYMQQGQNVNRLNRSEKLT